MLNGTEEFKKEVARLAGIHGMNVVFSDPVLNILKNEVGQHDRNNTNDSIQEWIKDRNQYAGSLFYVAWRGEEDIFNYYAGRRKIGEKTVLLFEINSKIFVKEISKRGFI